MARITIVIDDNDRDEAPDLPWAAYIEKSDIDHVYNVEAGLGATPAEALAELAATESNWVEG
jgi:hypothetical protein